MLLNMSEKRLKQVSGSDHNLMQLIYGSRCDHRQITSDHFLNRLVGILFIVVGVINAFHKHFTVVDFVGQSSFKQ